MGNNKPVVGHVTFDEVTGGQSRHQGELPRQDGTADHPGQLAGVLARLVGAADPEHLQTRFGIRKRQTSCQKHLKRVTLTASSLVTVNGSSIQTTRSLFHYLHVTPKCRNSFQRNSSE